MIAIDTNVLVRFLTGDDADQAPRTRRLIDAERIFLPLTVCLEAEWVLRSAYRFPRRDILTAIRNFAGLPNVEVETPQRLARALDHADAGMDFADALHLGAASDMAGFASFDLRLIRKGQELGLTGLREP